MTKFFLTLPIRKKLICLITAALIPVVGLLAYTMLERRNTDVEAAKHDIFHRTRSLVGQHEPMVSGTRELLEMLAGRPEVQQLNSRACVKLLTDIQKREPVYAVLKVARLDGTVFAASQHIDGDDTNMADQKHFTDAVKKRRFSAGQFVAGEGEKIPLLYYSYPVIDGSEKLVGVVSAAVNLEIHKKFIDALPLPNDSVVTFIDSGHRVLYRIPEYKGLPLGHPFLRKFSLICRKP